MKEERSAAAKQRAPIGPDAGNMARAAVGLVRALFHKQFRNVIQKQSETEEGAVSGE